MNRLLLISLIASSLPGKAQFELQSLPAEIASLSIREASGLAVSPTDQSLLWIICDSGAKPEIHLTNQAGIDLGSVTLKGVTNHDWEDLSSFTAEGKPFLLIADTGDNGAKRKSLAIHILPEPGLPMGGAITDHRTILFRYPDGPRDCESVAVDPTNGKVFLITKRTKPPEIYELPLVPETQEIQIARKIGKIDVNPPSFNLVPFSSQPTALDISADGKTAAILTYYGVFVLRREQALSWEDAFKLPAVALPPHGLPQAEGLAISADGKAIFVISEGKNSRLVTYELVE